MKNSMVNIEKKFKNLTGYNRADISNEFKVSRQFIPQSLGNYSMTYQNSNRYMFLVMINKRIKELQTNIELLKELQKEILEADKEANS